MFIAEFLQGFWWIMIFVWTFVLSYIINEKCRCQKCKRRLRIQGYSELSIFTLYYWPSSVKLRCIYCGQLLNESDDGSLDPIRISNTDLQSRLIHKVDPVYPQFIKSTGVSGAVVLTVTTNEEGAVVETRRVSGNPIFVEAAAVALRQWRYSPTLIDGRPVPVEFDVHGAFLSDGTVAINTKSVEEYKQIQE